ncbi:hypothetical protein E4U54_003773 [Claviceps lovelessii]|nr:hypothetical protein E4U54_003773 [Claviceps lovelessii]
MDAIQRSADGSQTGPSTGPEYIDPSVLGHGYDINQAAGDDCYDQPPTNAETPARQHTSVDLGPIDPCPRPCNADSNQNLLDANQTWPTPGLISINPAFLVQGYDDTIQATGNEYYQPLTNAGVPARQHISPDAGTIDPCPGPYNEDNNQRLDANQTCPIPGPADINPAVLFWGYDMNQATGNEYYQFPTNAGVPAGQHIWPDAGLVDPCPRLYNEHNDQGPLDISQIYPSTGAANINPDFPAQDHDIDQATGDGHCQTPIKAATPAGQIISPDLGPIDPYPTSRNEHHNQSPLDASPTYPSTGTANMDRAIPPIKEENPDGQSILPELGPIDPYPTSHNEDNNQRPLDARQTYPSTGAANMNRAPTPIKEETPASPSISPDLRPMNPDPSSRNEDNNQSPRDARQAYPSTGAASMNRATTPINENTPAMLFTLPDPSNVFYVEALEFVPVPSPDNAIPRCDNTETRPPPNKRRRRTSPRRTDSRLQSRLGSRFGPARAGRSGPGSASSAPRSLTDGQRPGETETDTADNEPPSHTINQRRDSHASGSPLRPAPGRRPVQLTSEITFRSPYTSLQLCASDADARRMFRAPAAFLQVDSVAYLREIRQAFPFYGTGITLKDRESGYYTLDADGLPVLHDRVLKADREADSQTGESTRRKRKSVHQLQTPRNECYPARWYDTWKYTPKSWPPDSNKFVYLEDAQLAYREYSTEDIKLYLEQCPRDYILWVQSEPPQSTHRQVGRDGKDCPEDTKCRWADCPIKGSHVMGLYRVAFDEFPAQTSQGIKDPYKVAMLLHLWCFERILDPLVYYNRGVLLPDTRTFATPAPESSSTLWEMPESERDPENIGRAEKKNNFCSKLGDAQRPWTSWGPLNNAFYPWFRDTEATETMPRLYEKSLCYSLTSWCVGNLPKCKTDQFDKRTQAKAEKKTAEQRNREREDNEARKRMRETRKNAHTNGSGADAQDLPPESEAYKGTTFHVHLGSLAGYKRASDERTGKQDRFNKKRPRGTLVAGDNGAQPQEAGSSRNVQDGREFGIRPDAEPQPDDIERPSKRRRTSPTA